MKITERDLFEKQDSINQKLAEKNSKWQIVVAFRYDYTAIDFRKVGSGAIYATLASGLTKKEAWYFLCGMSNTLYLLDKEN